MGTIKQFPGGRAKRRVGVPLEELGFIIDLCRRSSMAREALEADYATGCGLLVPGSFLEVLWDSIVETLTNESEHSPHLIELFGALDDSHGLNDTVNEFIERTLLEYVYLGDRADPTVRPQQRDQLVGLLGPKLLARLADVALRLDGPQ